MLEVILCGAEDTSDVAIPFKEVVASFGGTTSYFKDGTIRYNNSSYSSWEENSKNTVKDADLCVFVIMEKLGMITWTTEITTALDEGKNFLLLCDSKVNNLYYNSKMLVNDSCVITEQYRSLFEFIDELMLEYKLTMVPFDRNYFRDVLRQQISEHFKKTLKLQEEKNRIDNLFYSIKKGTKLTHNQNNMLLEVAKDETKDKTLRKGALQILCTTGIDIDSIYKLLSSLEQGVYRFVIENLDKLYKERPFPNDLFDFCIDFANKSDDIWVIRKIISTIIKIDFKYGLLKFQDFDLSDIGTRRRIAAIIEEHEVEIRDLKLNMKAIEILDLCEDRTNTVGWIPRLKACRERLLIEN